MPGNEYLRGKGSLQPLLRQNATSMFKSNGDSMVMPLVPLRVLKFPSWNECDFCWNVSDTRVERVTLYVVDNTRILGNAIVVKHSL